MTKVLGIYDWHNCSAAYVEDGRLIAAVEEERLTRNKVEFGLPVNAIKMVLRMGDASWDDLDAIAVCGVYDPTPVVRWNQRKFQFQRKAGTKLKVQYALWRTYYAMRNFPFVRRFERLANRKIIQAQIGKLARVPGDKIHHVEHHLCHASVGYRTSGFDDALIFALDGSGDGYSTSVFMGRGGEISFYGGASERASLGKFYANATLGLGFKKLTGEGKLMGLAAYADPELYYKELERVIYIKDVDNVDFGVDEDLLGNRWADKVNADLGRFTREQIAAAVQKRFEDLILQLIRHFVDKTKTGNVVLVGGAAMNVKLNQRVRETEGVDHVSVFPAMTDAGVSAGAALQVCHEIIKGRRQNAGPYVRIENAYLGPGYDNNEIKAVLSRRGYGARAEFFRDINRRVGELVAGGAIVARFEGRMEYGPRALGNRSVLALCSKEDIEDVLNKRLGRDEFMPFAPSILEDRASEYLERFTYSPFMVETFDVKPEYRKALGAVVHEDGTLRPQIVRKSVAPGYWEIIDTIGKLTGLYLVLNTSYNIHGEPIVCSPDDALNTFEHGCVDYLAMGGWLLKLEPGDITRVRGYTDEG